MNVYFYVIHTYIYIYIFTIPSLDTFGRPVDLDTWGVLLFAVLYFFMIVL